jgi:small-conductance mechanosensitive channel
MKGCETCGTVFSFNIMSNEVSLRTTDGDNIRIPLALIKSIKQRTEQEKKIEQDKRTEYKKRTHHDKKPV